MKLTVGTQQQYRIADKKGHALWNGEYRSFLEGLKRAILRRMRW